MAFKEFNCPSCGAALQLEYRFTETVICPYCQQSSHWTGENFEAKGEKVILADYGSKFSVGLQASFWGTKLGERKEYKFKVLGRVRFEYNDGFWDEWLLRVEGYEENEYWLQEDEGEFFLFKKFDNLPSVSDYNELKVGMYIDWEEYKMFISEKAKAQIVGGEGELPFRVIPGEQCDFIDGILLREAIPVSIEYLPDNKKAFYVTIFNLDINDFIFTEKKQENVY